MAPEAFDGKRNAQTDIWAVGVILYQLLTGNLPFPQKEMIELIGALVLKEPEPLHSLVPPALRNVVKKSLAKQAAERYHMASEIYQELQNILGDFSELETITDYNLSETTIIKTQISPNEHLIPYRKGDM